MAWIDGWFESGWSIGSLSFIKFALNGWKLNCFINFLKLKFCACWLANLSIPFILLVAISFAIEIFV